MTSMKISFFGATGTVTGSKYLVEAGGQKLLIDCGLFQGFKQLRLRNWAPPPFDARTIDAVLLTHAHIDHSGYLPLLVKQGFRGKVYCSAATRDLCGILLPDAAHLQEEEARFANKHDFSKHRPALPLFDADDAKRALKLLHVVDFGQEIRLGDGGADGAVGIKAGINAGSKTGGKTSSKADTKSASKLVSRLATQSATQSSAAGGVSFHFVPNGHILGSACVVLNAGGRTAVFSGDLGRPSDPIIKAPEAITHADILVLESTYGNRLHGAVDPERLLGDIISRTAQRGGVVVIPAFAVGRAQSVLYFIDQLKRRNAIPDVPVYLNSPMAIDATRLYRTHRALHRLTPAQCHAMCTVAQPVNSPEESRMLNLRKGPMIIVSASGMATGGRVLHHIKQFAPDERNTLLFAGFQAGGTRGAALVAGADSVKIHGEYVPVRAEVAQVDVLSSHADYAEILMWLRNFKTPPKETFLVHGEPAAADALRRRISEELGWRCSVPEYLETAVFD